MKMRSKVLSIVGTIGCIVMSHNITNFNQCISVRDASCNLNSALNYNEEGTGTFILNALKIAL